MNVIIASTYLSTQATVLQNLHNQLIAAMTTTSLGQIVSSATLINVAQAVAGIARARIVSFNITGMTGTVLNVQALNNQYLIPNNIIIRTESY